MATGIDIAKAGWLYRQTSVLHRWKRNWFVLYRDGDLKYFESPDHPRAEERIVVRAVVMSIKTGPDCRRSEPPEGHSHLKSSAFELVMRDRESMLLYAESLDDMRAWQIALEEARTVAGPNRSTTNIIQIAPPGYMTYTNSYGIGGGGYPGYTINPPPYTAQATVIHGVNGNTTTVMAPPAQQVVYMDDYPYRRRYYRGGPFYGPTFWW